MDNWRAPYLIPLRKRGGCHQDAPRRPQGEAFPRTCPLDTHPTKGRNTTRKTGYIATQTQQEKPEKKPTENSSLSRPKRLAWRQYRMRRWQPHPGRLCAAPSARPHRVLGVRIGCRHDAVFLRPLYRLDSVSPLSCAAERAAGGGA